MQIRVGRTFFFFFISVVFWMHVDFLFWFISIYVYMVFILFVFAWRSCLNVNMSWLLLHLHLTYGSHFVIYVLPKITWVFQKKKKEKKPTIFIIYFYISTWRKNKGLIHLLYIALRSPDQRRVFTDNWRNGLYMPTLNDNTWKLR